MCDPLPNGHRQRAKNEKRHSDAQATGGRKAAPETVFEDPASGIATPALKGRRCPQRRGIKKWFVGRGWSFVRHGICSPL
jgi:hypothetical protein